jgi:hypothetical protein
MMVASLTSLTPPAPPSSPSPESVTYCSAPTKKFHPDKAYSNESNACHKRCVPSPCRWHQPVPLSSTDEPGNTTAQTDPDKADYADGPYPNPAGEFDFLYIALSRCHSADIAPSADGRLTNAH